VPFKDVVAQHGHVRLAGLLARSVGRDALPPSLIFSGPVESGTREMAIALAQALNCLSPVAFDGEPVARRAELTGARDACGVCAACSRISRGVHPDVVVVEPGDNGSIKIDQIRDVIDRSAFRPFEGRRRVVIIDEADAMAAPAQSALLKTLEEPPSSSVFVLVSARPDMLLPTVQSRCPRLRFQASAHEAVDVEAREVAQQVLLGAASTGDPAVRIEGARDLLANTGGGGHSDREQLASHLHAMASLLRDVELLSSRARSGGSASSDVNADLANADVRPSLDRLTKPYGGDRGLHAFAAVDRALEALDSNAGVKIVADWLVLQL
jgi:DNA polymerase-3 subunit delta'